MSASLTPFGWAPSVGMNPSNDFLHLTVAAFYPSRGLCCGFRADRRLGYLHQDVFNHIKGLIVSIDRSKHCLTFEDR